MSVIFRPRTLIRAGMRKLASAAGRFSRPANDYAARIRAEKGSYDRCATVHDLPKIFHYWSDWYVRPKLEAFGMSHPGQLFTQQFERQCRRDLGAQNSFVSIGSGNGDFEIATAAELAGKGLTNFTIECLDLNGNMLERGQQLADRHQVQRFMKFAEGDFNDWHPAGRYDVVMAHQSLHHVS